MSELYQLRQSATGAAEMFEPRDSSIVTGLYTPQTLGSSG